MHRRGHVFGHKGDVVISLVVWWICHYQDYNHVFVSEVENI